MEAVFLLDHIGLPRLDAALGAGVQAQAAGKAVLCDLIPLGVDGAAPKGIGGPEDGADPQVEVLDLPSPDGKDQADLPGVPGVDVGQIGLLGKDAVDPRGLLLFRQGDGPGGQADHLLILRVAQDLHPAVGQQFLAEVLSPGGEEVEGVGFVVDGADVAHLGAAVPAHGGKGQHPHVFQLFQTGGCVHGDSSFGYPGM